MLSKLPCAFKTLIVSQVIGFSRWSTKGVELSQHWFYYSCATTAIQVPRIVGKGPLSYYRCSFFHKSKVSNVKGDGGRIYYLASVCSPLVVGGKYT